MTRRAEEHPVPEIEEYTLTPPGGETPRLGSVLRRLEAIRREMDRDDLELEDHMRLYREGCELVMAARGILQHAAAEIEVLMGEAPRPSDS
jgi:exodeoxyribonuclease VII small subunit